MVHAEKKSCKWQNPRRVKSKSCRIQNWHWLLSFQADVKIFYKLHSYLASSTAFDSAISYKHRVKRQKAEHEEELKELWEKQPIKNGREWQQKKGGYWEKPIEMPQKSMMLSLMASKGLKLLYYNTASDIHDDSGSKKNHMRYNVNRIKQKNF